MQKTKYFSAFFWVLSCLLSGKAKFDMHAFPISVAFKSTVHVLLIVCQSCLYIALQFHEYLFLEYVCLADWLSSIVPNYVAQTEPPLLACVMQLDSLRLDAMNQSVSQYSYIAVSVTASTRHDDIVVNIMHWGVRRGAMAVHCPHEGSNVRLNLAPPRGVIGIHY